MPYGGSYYGYPGYSDFLFYYGYPYPHYYPYSYPYSAFIYHSPYHFYPHFSFRSGVHGGTVFRGVRGAPRGGRSVVPRPGGFRSAPRGSRH